MRMRDLMGLTVATVLALAPILGFPQQGGRPPSAGPPAGVGMPIGPSGARGPLTMPDRSSKNPGPASAAERGLATAAEARRLHARELWRAHREQLDFDPQGELIVRGEIVGFGLSEAALGRAQAEGFAMRRQDRLEPFDATVVALEAPPGMSMRRALRKLRSIDRDGAYDFNHVYLESAASNSAADQTSPPQQSAARVAGDITAPRRIGLVDGGVASSHPTLRAATVHTHGCDGSSVPTEHGTAIASLLLNTAAQPPARDELFVADVYCGAPTGGAVDALVEALAWLVREQVPVINVSLVGPPNALLQRAISLATARGHVIVASVGNDGPAARPLYPAAYPEVIAVTGVDRSDRVLLEAGRGRFVDFAAPGTDILAAHLPDGRSSVRGTSFAAPIVAGLLAQRLARPDRQLAEQAVRDLAATATDLGGPGFDPVYGNGLVGRAPVAGRNPPSRS